MYRVILGFQAAFEVITLDEDAVVSFHEAIKGTPKPATLAMLSIKQEKSNCEVEIMVGQRRDSQQVVCQHLCLKKTTQYFEDRSESRRRHDIHSSTSRLQFTVALRLTYVATDPIKAANATPTTIAQDLGDGRG